MTVTAITREVSPCIGTCALTFLDRTAIDVERAVCQHNDYERHLAALGVRVVSLPAPPDLPDAVFVEDTAVVLDEVAVMTSPMLESRRREVESVAAVLERYRPLLRIEGDAHLEGGDVLRIGRTVYVGLSRRTNCEGASQLARFLAPWGYRVQPVEVRGCLHLKTGGTYLGGNTLLANPTWIDCAPFDGLRILEVPEEEPDAANVLLLGEVVLLAASFPRTRAMLRGEGFPVESVDISELQKAEAGLTCCSAIFEG